MLQQRFACLASTWWSLDPGHAQEVARALGSDVPACLLEFAPARAKAPETN